jgi:hypothetical protein
MPPTVEVAIAYRVPVPRFWSLQNSRDMASDVTSAGEAMIGIAFEPGMDPNLAVVSTTKHENEVVIST